MEVMSMNIPEISMSLAQSRTLNDVGVALLSKSLDMMESNGATMVDMMKSSMELSVNPSIGGNLDMYV
jgi:hypothetical protein